MIGSFLLVVLILITPYVIGGIAYAISIAKSIRRFEREKEIERRKEEERKAKELRKQQDALRKQQEAERKAREKAEKKKEKSGPSFFDLLFSDSDNNNA